MEGRKIMTMALGSAGLLVCVPTVAITSLHQVVKNIHDLTSRTLSLPERY